jgi:hypothetical protein
MLIGMQSGESQSDSDSSLASVNLQEHAKENDNRNCVL